MYFVPQVEGKSANLVGSVSSTISILQSQSDAHSSLCGTANVTYAVLRSDRCRNDLVPVHGNAFQIRTPAVGDNATAGKNGVEQEQIKKYEAHEDDSSHDEASTCAFRTFAEEKGEEDELAFRITEFFKSANDVEACLHSKTLEHDPENEPCETTQPAFVDGPSASYRLTSFRYEEFIEGGIPEHVNNVGQSAKWNGFESGAVSEAIPFSGQLFYSGYLCPASHSGNVSHRSDSSTTSTHSFAFPILPCEWNSSPVKMTVPEERYVKAPWKKRVCRFFCCESAANLPD